MGEGNHFETYNLAIHPFRGILLKVDEVSPMQTRLLSFQIEPWVIAQFHALFNSTVYTVLVWNSCEQTHVGTKMKDSQNRTISVRPL